MPFCVTVVTRYSFFTALSVSKPQGESKMQDSPKQIIQFRNGIDSCVQKSKMVLDCLCVLEGLFGEYHSSLAALGDGYPRLNLCQE